MTDGAMMAEIARIEARAQQFSTYVEMTEALTERQATVIRYYIALNTAMVGAGGVVFVGVFQQAPETTSIYLYVFLLLIAFTGRFFCRLWRDALLTLRYWESKKYKIIRETEETEPHLAEFYAREWREHGAEAKGRARERVLALPGAFLRFYWGVALLTFVALAFELDDSLFGGALAAWVHSVAPSVARLPAL